MGLSVLDDRDSSIDYSSGWSKAGSSLEFNRTTTWSVVSGSTAKVTFQGTSIGVYGTISAKQRRSVAPVSEYSIDGGSQVEFTPTQAARAQYSQLFFQSPVMSDGAHTLIITNKLASADPLFLDFMFVLNTSPDSSATGALPTLSSAVPGSSTSSGSISSSTSASSSSSSSTSSSASSTSSTVSSTSSTSLNTITVTTFESQSSSSPTGVADNANNNAGADDVGAAKKSNAGAIVGGVFAGIIVLAFLVFGFFYWNRRRQRRNSFMDYKTAGSGSYWNRPLDAAATPASIPPPQTIEPFPTDPPRPPMTQAGASASSYGQPQGAAYAQGQGQSQHYPGGYMPATPGPDYYESSDIAYAVNPEPAPAGYGYGYNDSRESDIYAAQQVQHAPQGYNGGGGYVPPSQLMQNGGSGNGYVPPSNYYAAQNQPGQRVRTRLD
ncbi:hypothetical protein CVT25_000490 [Psilocybe cyanescens]|uniref:Mid2 domain-containing protein n=1 Tax=Psilocybe cyanescens TaxID=93625 RepID=A0A409XW88_PSICY|nr:hypothetical protein CVT25_000490 [Psilocybe cyanescens]